MPATLIAAGLHAGYPGAEVLRDVHLSVREGTPPLGLVGASGAGKTTLLEALAGRLRPSRGRVTYRGRALGRMRGRGARDFRADVRFVTQDSLTVTDPRETVAGRLARAAKLARRAGRTHPLTPEHLLESAGLDPHLLPRRTATLSGGELQRLALAAALATRPRILLLDEPLTAVDPHARAAITRRLGATIAQLGMGALVASHDLTTISRLCPEIAVLDDGALVGRGPLTSLLDEGSHPALRDLAENVPRASRPAALG